MKKIIVITVFFLNVISMLAQNQKLWWDKDETGKYGILEKATKKVVVKYQYDEVKLLKSDNISGNEVFKTKLNGKYGVIDKLGNEIVAPKYDEIKFFSQAADWIETKLNGKFGFMEISRGIVREVFSPQYDEYFYPGGDGVGSGFIEVRLGTKWGLMNKTSSKEITNMKYDEVSNGFFNSSLAEVKLNNKWGYIDKTGKEIIPCKYEKAGRFSDEENKAEVMLNGKTIYINKLGKAVK